MDKYHKVNMEKYIKALRDIRKSLDLIQNTGNFQNTSDILLMLILNLELCNAEYELSKEQDVVMTDDQ